MTVKELISRAASKALGVPKSPLQLDVRDAGLDAYNLYGRKIHDVWPWDNTKVDEITCTPDDDGIITLPAYVDTVRAVRCVSQALSSGSYGVPNRDPVVAYHNDAGGQPTRQYEVLADDDDGFRRIWVPGDSTSEYVVLPLRRFVEVTANNYDTESFPIDRAEPALFEYVFDYLREWGGLTPGGKGQSTLDLAIRRETEITQRDVQKVPAVGKFQQVGYFEE